MYDIARMMTLAGFQDDAVSFFQDAYQKVTDTAKDLYRDAVEQYWQNYRCEEALDAIGAKTGLHRYSVDMLMLLGACCKLEQRYAEKGYPHALFCETLFDLRSKLDECLTVFGIYGTFVLLWFDGFFSCDRFKLGRLQFETVVLEQDFPGLVSAGTTVLNCHIPSGLPMTMEDVMDSFAQAYRFYGYTDTMPVMCASWMLYPPHYPLFPEGSNLQRFYQLFRLGETKDRGGNYDAWRIFGTMDEDPEKWPQRSKLQKNLCRYLKEGNTMGYGVGFYFYKPTSM